MSRALHSIVCVSSAVHLPSREELEHLLERARERNREGDVTGLLLYGDGNFMQFIEGPHAELMRIYRIIREDPLHTGLIELMNEPALAREFADWQMAFTVQSMPTFLALSGARWRRQNGSETLTPGRALMRQVWKATTDRR